VQNEIGKAYRTSLSKVQDIMDMIARDVDKLSNIIASDSDVEEFLESYKETFPSYNTIINLQNISNSISISTDDYISSIYVYSEKSNYIITSNKGGINADRFDDNTWINEYFNRKKNLKMRWFSHRTYYDIFNNNRKYSYISCYYLAPANSYMKSGVIIINLDSDKIRQLINNMSNQTEETIFIADDEGNIIFGHDKYINKNILLIPGVEKINNTGTVTPKIIEIDGVNQVVIQMKSQFNNWNYISLIPLKIYDQKTGFLTQVIEISFLISFLIAIVVAFLISVRTYIPIKDIINVIDDPQKYYNEVYKENNTVKSIEKYNELKYIAMNILNSYNEKKYMQDELERRMIMFQRAQNAALQSQINPHFLNNTLQTISWLTMKLTNGENEASMVIKSLSEFLHFAMETETYLIPIEEEIQYTMSYVKIQQVRYRTSIRNLENNLFTMLYFTQN